MCAENAAPPQDSEMKTEVADAENTENQGDACDAAREHAAEAAEEQLKDEEEVDEEQNNVEPPQAADVDTAVNDESIAGPQGGHSTTAPEADKDGVHLSFDVMLACCLRCTEHLLPQNLRQLHLKTFIRGLLVCACAAKESVA